jgi:hypothetical protein
MTGDRVLLALPGVGTLDLPRDVYERHLVPAQSLPASPTTSPALLSADDLEARTGIPASWWMARARERRVPCQRFGRRVRFDYAEVMASEAVRKRGVL